MLRWTGGSRNRVKAAGGGRGRGADFGPPASRPHALIQCRQHRCPPPSFLTQDNNNNNNGSLASLEHHRNSSGGETKKRPRSTEGDDGAANSVDIADMMGGVCRAAHQETTTDWTSRQPARRGSSLPQITSSSLMSSSHDIDALMWATRSTTLSLASSGQGKRPYSTAVVVAGSSSSAAAAAAVVVPHVAQPRSILVRSAEVKVPSILPPPPHQLLPSPCEYRDAASSSIFFEEGSSDDDAQTDAIAETFTSAQHSSQLLQQLQFLLPSSSSSFDRQLFPAPSLWAATPAAAAPRLCFQDPYNLQPTADNHNNWSYLSDDDWSYVTASPPPPPLLDYYCPPDHTQHHPSIMTSSWSGGWEADRALPPPLPSAFAVNSRNHHQRYCRDSE
ncbi:Hypothetical protein, putative [Bodo saltans]|uniref:Uncharacterized protein n=1 Tax=Bodo saltans TaxID=75058 RepID=A0A0S4IT14_BODSA|nr:Hypothetical protein, putative [Bodo saltans]|eukprot:CUF77395.1 Hypothetical protein, putative [Bodo saltans]